METIKKNIANKIAIVCTEAFILVALLIIANHVIDVPFLVFNRPPTPANWVNIGIDLFFVMVIGAFAVYWISKLDLERKRAEERLEHLNLVLRAIRNVNQLITQEKDHDRLLKGVCNNLIETRGYCNTWLVLWDESGGLVTTAEAGLGEDFLPVVGRLKRGEFTDCGHRALMQSEVVVTEDPFSTCTDCPLADKYRGRGAMTVRLEYGEKVYGVLSISTSATLAADKEEQSLFRETSGDIAFALHNIELEEERKQTEEKIRQAAEEWRTTFDSITDLVSIHDKDFKLARVNKAFAEAFRMEPKELIGKTCYEVVHGTKEPWPDCPHQKTLKSKEPLMVEIFEPHLGVHLEVSTSPVFNEEGEVVASVHIARDISGRKQMEQQLMITDRLASVGELASGVAHELNNLLTSVIGFSQLLLDRDMADDVKQDIEVVYAEAQRAAEVVKNLLTFARKHAPVKQLVKVNGVIEKVLELRAYEHKVNNIRVNTEFNPDLPEVMADYFQLQQVFLNIIINAEYFMIEAHNRGTLSIITGRMEDTIRIIFVDDGPGIAEDDLGHLFDPFFTTKEVGKGTGLGLSICHGIITEHGGKIYAESELGKGATFVVELPISDHE